jgi:hypothetical protein
MAEPTTWTELKANIADWLDRTDLTTQIPEFIGYAERRFNRDLRVPEMEESSSSSSSGSTITLPADFLQMRSTYIDRSPINFLKQVSMAELREMFPTTDTGVPTHFALQSGSEMVVRPLPGDSYTYVTNYWQKIPALGSGQAANWLLTAHPDLYLAQSMVEAMIFLRDTEGLSLWERRAGMKLDALNEQGRKKAWASAPLSPQRSTTNIPNIRA